MKTETLDITTPEGRAALAALGVRQKRGRATRPDIPSAPRQERTGLGPLLVRGWNVYSPDSVRYRLYKVGLDTGLCATEKAACDAAKELEK